mmetsp:Transcript_3682/g.6663  ORF Transcript_3682/g.6663 Transcript_3682/m.6663 type:complete len:222 (+) Transcript_3682:356-1021(+)
MPETKLVILVILFINTFHSKSPATLCIIIVDFLNGSLINIHGRILLAFHIHCRITLSLQRWVFQSIVSINIHGRVTLGSQGRIFRIIPPAAFAILKHESIRVRVGPVLLSWNIHGGVTTSAQLRSIHGGVATLPLLRSIGLLRSMCVNGEGTIIRLRILRLRQYNLARTSFPGPSRPRRTTRGIPRSPTFLILKVDVIVNLLGIITIIFAAADENNVGNAA